MPSAAKKASRLARVDDKAGETATAPLMTDGARAVAAAMKRSREQDDIGVGSAITALNTAAANRQANML